MKKLLILMLLSQSISAQKEVKKDPKFIYVGELSNMGNFIADIKYSISDKDTVYIFEFHNDGAKANTKMEIVSFTGQSDLNKLYANLMSVFSDTNRMNPNYSLNMNLGESTLIIANSRAMAVAYAYISTEHGHITLSEKQVKKLFDRS